LFTVAAASHLSFLIQLHTTRNPLSMGAIDLLIK